MTESFAKMIEYQSLDMKLRAMNREYNKHPDKKKLDATRAKFNDAQAKLDQGADAKQLHAECIGDKFACQFKFFHLFTISSLSLKIELVI